MKTLRRFLYILPLCLAPCSHATYFLITPQTGAQTQIDVNHSTVWTNPPYGAFDPLFNWDLGGGQFEMKDGPQTDTNPDSTITLAIWDGPMGSLASAVASVTLTLTEFCAQLGAPPSGPGSSGCQNFDTVNFTFATPFTLLAGHHYTAALVSSVADEQAKAYFIKDPTNLQIRNENGDNLVPPTEQSTVPEPGSWVLIASGCAMVALAKMRRGRR